MNREDQINAELKRMIPVLINRFHATLIVLFGSSAEGRISEWSDLDLVIVRETSLRFTDRIGELLSALKPRIGVDFFVYTPREWRELLKANRFVKEEMLGKGKVLHAA